MVNITMLAHNRPRLTKQALDSLAKHTVNRDARVTIRYDWGDPDTFEVISKWNLELGSKLVFGESEGTGPARNEVISASETNFGRGDYLYLSDNDVFFYPGWLGNLIQAERQAWDAGFKAIGAYNHPFHQPVSVLPITKGRFVLCNVHQVHALATQSMLMRWEVWGKYGPFCETPVGKVCQSEDVDFCNRITKDGYKVGVVSPALVVNTGITNSFGEKIPGWELVKSQCPEGVICE